MDDLPIEKVAISGPTLASMIQRFSSSYGDVDGLIFGHVTQPSPSNLLDDDDADSATRSNSPTFTANITNYYCSGSVSTFYDSLGRLNISALHRSLENQPPNRSLIGWFVGRRRTALRPSMRDFSVSSSLISKTLTLNPRSETLNFPPCVFIVLSTPLTDQLIHTHEYRAFQFRRSSGVFEPKSIDVINIGPAFRGHYGAFSPNSALPWLSCAVRDPSAMSREIEMGEERSKESMNLSRRVSKEQKVLDLCAEGFEVGRLSKLMGSEGSNYTSELEDLYGKMLGKLEGLARLVEKSSAKVLEQEHRNMKLRSKFAGLE